MWYDYMEDYCITSTNQILYTAEYLCFLAFYFIFVEFLRFKTTGRKYFNSVWNIISLISPAILVSIYIAQYDFIYKDSKEDKFFYVYL
jgi:hypothetical protein